MDFKLHVPGSEADYPGTERMRFPLFAGEPLSCTMAGSPPHPLRANSLRFRPWSSRPGQIIGLDAKLRLKPLDLLLRELRLAPASVGSDLNHRFNATLYCRMVLGLSSFELFIVLGINLSLLLYL